MSQSRLHVPSFGATLIVRVTMIMPRVTMIAHIKDTGTTGKEGRRPRKSGNPGTGPLYAIRICYIEEKKAKQGTK